MATAALDDYYLYRKTIDTGRLALSSPTNLFGSGVDSNTSTLTNIGFTLILTIQITLSLLLVQMDIFNLEQQIPPITQTI